MNRYEVEFSARALDQLAAQQLYIEHEPTQSAALATRFAENLVSYIERDLALMPLQGQERDDIRPRLRTTHYKGSTMIAFVADEENQWLFIEGLFSGGQDFESALQED